MSSHRLLMALGVSACCAAASGSTLRVGPGRAFTDIQSAVDAAAAGDLILVDAGVYAPFALVGKGVTIQGDPGFTVDDTSGNGTVRVLAVPAGPPAVIRGMDLVGVFANGVALEVEFCSGEVILEDIAISEASGRVQLLIHACDRVFATDLAVTGAGTRITFPARPIPVWIQTSQVALTGLQVQGGGASENVRIEAGSEVVVAAPRISGATGVSSGGCIFDPDGSLGAAGMVVSDSRVMVVGTSIHFIRGGDGGEGSPCGFGGDGAAALRILGSSEVSVSSRVSLAGGSGGGGGSGPGNPGASAVGPVDTSSDIPSLTLTPLQVGGPATLTLSASPFAAGPLPVVLLISAEGAFASAGPLGGPPLSVVLSPPSRLLVTATDAAGFLSLGAPLPADPALAAFPLHLQAGVFDPAGPDGLSNVVVRSVRP